MGWRGPGGENQLLVYYRPETDISEARTEIVKGVTCNRMDHQNERFGDWDGVEGVKRGLDDGARV